MFFIQRELSVAMEALREKRRREAALLKERNDKLDDRDVNKYVQQGQAVANRISAKMAAGNYNLGESVYDQRLQLHPIVTQFIVDEKKELAVILSKMNDLNASIDWVGGLMPYWLGFFFFFL